MREDWSWSRIGHRDSTDAPGCGDNRRIAVGALNNMLSSQELVWLMAAVAKGDRAAFERAVTRLTEQSRLLTADLATKDAAS